MLTRLAAGLSGLAVVLPILFWGGAWGVGVLVGIVLLVALDEYAGMAMPHDRARGRLFLFGGGLAVHLLAAYAPSDVAIVGLALVVAVLLSGVMVTQADVARTGDEAARLALGVVYAPLLLVPLLRIHARPDGVALTFYLLAVTWLGDTGAYFAGRHFGRRKLFERISPKKTVEGLFGGLALSMLGAGIVQGVGKPDMTLLEAVLIGGVLDLFGVVGDLAESMLKRAWGVKDSGWIMPGHGGILDRIDSLLFSAPLLWAWLSLR